MMIYTLFANVEKDYLCDYIKQTGKILGEKNLVLVAYYLKPYSWLYLLKNPPVFYRIIKGWWQIVSTRKSGVYDCEFISLLPFQHYYTIYKLNRRLTQWELKLLFFIRCFVQRIRESIILWVFYPTAEFFVGRLGEKVSLYDMVDSLEILTTEKDDLHKLEEKLLQKVDFVFSNSRLLAKTKEHIRKDIKIVPCGCAVDNFLPDHQPEEIPDALKNIKPPIIGFVGNIDYRMDWNLLEYLLMNNKKYSFILLGQIIEKTDRISGKKIPIIKSIEKLFKYPNFFLFPHVSKNELNDYYHYFNVGLIPYNINVVKFANPMKFYEYLAVGLPVVSVPIDAITGYDLPFLRFGYNNSDFNSKLKFIVGSMNSKENYKRLARKVASKNSWKEKVDKIISYIKI